MISFDPLLLRFAKVLGLVLASVLIGLAVLTPVLRRRKPDLLREIWLRYVAWVGIAILVVGSLALGRVAWIGLVALLALAAFREYARAVGLWLDRSFLAVVYSATLLIFVFVWYPYPDDYPEPGWYGMMMAMPVFATLAVLAVPIVRGEFEHMIQKTCLSILGVLYFGWFFAHFAYLRNFDDGLGYVLFLGFLVAINDVAAFVSGKFFGRHKLRPRLSPGKTVEGAVGALVVVTVAAWSLRWLVPSIPELHLLILGPIISLAGTAGDLALATIKRDLRIKDWSAAIPGHGGVLDRANSLLFSVPIFFHYVRYFFH